MAAISRSTKDITKSLARVKSSNLWSMGIDIDEYGEIMCHPALLDWRLYQMSSYNIPRMKELDLLCDKKIKQFIKDKDIELINYSNLKKTD